MRKKIIALFVCMQILCIASVFSQVTSTWNGSSIDTAWYHNNRDATEFTIYTAEELAGLEKLVNSYETFAGKTIYVGNGIDQVVIDLNNKTWTKIGTGSLHEFQGHFDGRNCIVKNLTVNSSSLKTGLFGYVTSTESSSAIVENVNVEGRVISTYSQVGGIVGCAIGTSTHRAMIKNCTFNGEVSAVNYSGGIVGDAGAYCDIIDCAVAGKITALESYAGGIVGRCSGADSDVNTYNQIAGCTNAAWIHTPENAGGISGYAHQSTIAYCNNGGCVFGNYTVGGIAGSKSDNCIIKYSISTGTVSAHTSGSTTYGGSIMGINKNANISYCYYDDQRSRTNGVYGYSDNANVTEGKHTSALTVTSNDEKPTALAGTESEWTSHFTFIAGYYPIPANISDKTVARLAALPIGLPESPLAYYNEPAGFTLMDGYTYTSNNTDIVNVSSNHATIGSTEGTAIITATSGEWSKAFVIEKPYTNSPVLTIATLSDLENFRNAVNDGARGSYQGVSAYNGFEGITIQITADIDMSSNSNWTPIGTNENPFCGTIDGQNKLLKNITVNRTNRNSGLFGVLNSAKIKNIKLTGRVKSNTSFLGGFCGRTKGTAIDSVKFENCHFNGTIEGSTYIGGIVGYTGTYCIIENCSAGGNITSTNTSCGGIIGQNVGSARIANCINVAEIKATNYAGGIIGYVQNGTKIHDCLNSGNVYGTSENTGGIAAFIGNNGSEIVNCINTGTVSSGGSIAGVRASNPTFTNNYYDNQRSIIGGVTNEDISGKAEGKTTSEILALTSGTLSDQWNFTGTSYPTPKNVGCGEVGDAVNNLVKIAAATVTFAGSEIYNEIATNFTLASGFSWSSSNTRLITVSGTSATLERTDPYGSVVLTATINNLEDVEYTKKVLTSVLGDNPYDITSYADLCAFRDAVNAGLDGSYKGLMNMDGYCGKTFKLTDNITIEDTWTPIGISATYPFRGNFNGNNHTISNLIVSNNAAYSGLFGYIYVSCGNGGISNLVVEGNVRGTSYVGGIVGYGRGLNSTTYFIIQNCHFNGSVIASSSYSGGVCGYIGEYSKAKESTATGEVISTGSYVGGIVGRSSGSNSGESNPSLTFCTYARDSVLNCANNAKVTGSSYVGGICGYNYMSEVRYCLNAGEVITTSGTATSIGGIVGYNDVYRAYVAQCLNVYGFNSKEGNIIGVDNDTITNCAERGSLNVNRNYFDSQQCALGIVTASNGTDKLTSELVATANETKPSGLSEFTAGKWWYKKGYYPMPINPDNALASTPVLLAATPIMLDVNAGEAVAPTNTNQLTTRDFNVTVADGQVWTVSDDSKITINGSTGAAHITNQFMRLTITATIGSYSKSMFLANTTYVPPIAISSEDELKAFRDAVNSGNIGMFEARVYDLATHTVTSEVVEAYNINGYRGVDFYLTSDIGLTNADWTAIGTALYPFKGKFHGQGNKITNLRKSTSSGSYRGLFGYIEEGSIDSLTIQGRAFINSADGTIDNIKINGSSYVAGLVGFAKKSVISQCHVAAVINNTGSYTGGICAEAIATTIQNCDFCGKINSAVDYAGGICGHADAEDDVATKIISCTNAASVTAANYVGGIVGACENGSEVKFCNNGGNISATTENAGGICGTLNASSITSCIATGGVNMGGPIVGSTEGDVTVTSCYFDKQRCDRTDSRPYVYDKYTSEMQGSALQSALGNTDWSYTASLYPMPKNLATQLGAKLAAIPLTLDKRGDASEHQTYRLVTQDFDLVSETGMTWKTNCVRNEETERTFLTINSNVPTVNGDEKDCANIFLKLTDNYHVKTFFIQNPETQDPIPISTLTEFIKFRNAVNAGETGSFKGIINESGFAGKNFQLQCDIDLAQSAYPDYQKAQTSNVNIKDDFLPVGSSSTNLFKGNFDGDNHTISNLKINGDGTNNNVPSTYKAVFGYVFGSTIMNLNVKGNISSSSYAAGICAYLRGAESSNYAQIINCSFIGEVESTGSYVGGICGNANNYTNIIGCEVSGRVAGGSNNIGGIAGCSVGTDDAINYIKNCINVANVGGSSYVGGICGQILKADIMYSTNGGNVSGTSYITAGIVGYNSGFALYCLNTGNVNTGAAISGVTNNCRYCYYDKTKSSVLGVSNNRNVSDDYSGSATGLTPQQIVGNTPTGLSGTNWNGTYWTFADDRYPVPVGHTSDIAMVSAIPIYLNDPEQLQVWNSTRENFKRVTTSGEYTWTSSFPEYVNVESTDVAVDPGADPEADICTAIVTVEKGDAKKKYIITSKETPTDLDINNETELIAFRNAVNNREGGKYKGVHNTNGYMGITFHIKNDITITESDAWEAIGSVPAAFFAGNIDGENHTVSEVNFSTTANPVKYLGGFIGKITGGYVEDLTVKMKSAGSGVPNVTKETGYFGGICASIEGVSALQMGEIKNCTFVGDSIYSNTQGSGAGGICGYAGSWTRITGCTNRASITGRTNTGGIIGYMSNTSPTIPYDNVIDCKNIGNIGVAASGGSNIGGICGQYVSTGNMINCKNRGNIKVNAYGGGIVGRMTGKGYLDLATITNCENFGDVSSNDSYSGGIVGLESSYSAIKNTANCGNVTGKSHTGGIVGLSQSNVLDNDNLISNCANSGSVEGTSYVGGICGKGERTVICYTNNGANVTGTTASTTGGIVGDSDKNSTVKVNIATGTVENGSSICGTSKGKLANNVYDMQRSKGKGRGTTDDEAGVAEGKKTSQLTGSALTGTIWTENFVTNDGYPIPKGTDSKIGSILASAAATFQESPEVEIYDSILNDFTVTTQIGEEPITWSVEEPSNIVISGSTANITRTCEEKKERIIYAENGGEKKAIKVILAELLPPDLTGTDTEKTTCMGQSVAISTVANDGYTYDWEGAGVLTDGVATATVVPTEATTYTVIVTNASSCTASASVDVNVESPSITGLTANDYIWTGGASENWDNHDNWVTYDSENSKYVQAAIYPNATTHNVFVKQYGDGCIHNWTTANQIISVNNVTLGENAKVNVSNDKTLSVSGDVTLGTAALLSADGTVKFVGTAVQTISGDGSLNFNNVTFNNANGINATNLSSPIKIRETATFTSGIVHGDVYFDKNATYNVDEVNSSKFVDGNITKKMENNDTFTFPVGAMVGDGQIAKFKATTANATDLTVRYNTDNQYFDGMPDWREHDGNMDGSSIHLDHVSDREYWIVGSTNETSLSTVQLYWDGSGSNHSFDTNADGGPDNLDYLRLAYANEGGFVWTGLTTSWEGNHDSGSATATTEVIPFSGTRATDRKIVTFASTKAKELLLPIELVEFSAHCNGNLVEILWTTASERNNDHFVVEKSYDAVNFSEITRISGAGNSIEQVNYSFIDGENFGSEMYYRLVQVDYDGNSTMSEIIAVKCADYELKPAVAVFPNPFRSELTLSLSNFGNKPATVEVFDMLGTLVTTMNIDATGNNYETVLNLGELSAATYTVRISTVDFVINKRIVKQ